MPKFRASVDCPVNSHPRAPCQVSASIVRGVTFQYPISVRTVHRPEFEVPGASVRPLRVNGISLFVDPVDSNGDASVWSFSRTNILFIIPDLNGCMCLTASGLCLVHKRRGVAA